jgi:5'-nucleotidase (lipoprotein e(P4) family)
METIRKSLVGRHNTIFVSVFLWLMLLSSTAVFGQAVGRSVRPQADNEYQEGAILWMQKSGEQRALAFQAFTLARLMLDRDLRMRSKTMKRRAVVVDIDETVLDNSRHQASLLKNHQNYDAKGWTEWVKLEQATAVPGSVDFLRYAASRGVQVFYITNRNQAEKDATAQNLKKLGFPGVTDQTLLVRTDAATSSKEIRRKSVAANFRIVLLMGDNLNDFSEVFEKSRTTQDRISAAENNRALFGTKFIVLPNPMYGDWENAIYDYNFKLTEEEKTAKRANALVPQDSNAEGGH